MKNTIKLTCLSIAALLTTHAEAQNFAKVYDAMPDMTLDQTYSALIDFQKANPYFANTYIQLGSVCEKKMVIYDPLREIESVNYWAKNAQLFFGNLKVYYKENDCRSEFYENLKIPFVGKRITDADLWEYVNKHKANCQNHSDSTSLIYAAIESARLNYNKALESFRSIYDDYSDLNDMLLRYNDKLAKRLKQTKDFANECDKQFAEYKRLTKLYPIANYKQLYEKIPIETFRLDGLTNSDFFCNRFNIWDYASWINNFEKTFTSEIAPLRLEVERINNDFNTARAEFDNGKVVSSANNKPYDELFQYKLGHFDVGSVVDVLFDYLNATRVMIAMAGDSLGRNVGDDLTLESRKMRRLSRLYHYQNEVDAKRTALLNTITPNKIERFADFFNKQYSGESGLRSFISRDADYCQTIIDRMSDATADYIEKVRKSLTTKSDIYSTPNGAAAPALPLWVSLDPQSVTSKHVATHVGRNANGQVAVVAGHLKANVKSWFVAGISQEQATQWVLNLKGVNSVTAVSAASEGVLLAAIRQLKPAIIYVGSDGKEVSSLITDAEIVDFMDRDGVTGSIFWASGNDQNSPVLSKASDGAVAADWSTTIYGLAKVSTVNVVANGFVVTGLTPQGQLATVNVTSEGVAASCKVIANDVQEIVSTQRVSSGEMAALVKLTTGGSKYTPYSIGE